MFMNIVSKQLYAKDDGNYFVEEKNQNNNVKKKSVREVWKWPWLLHCELYKWMLIAIFFSQLSYNIVNNARILYSLTCPAKAKG